MHLLRNVLTYSAVATLALTLAACSSAPQTTSEEGSSPSARPTPKSQGSGRAQGYGQINQQPTQPRVQRGGSNETPKNVNYGGRGNGNYSAQQLSGDFAGNPQLLAFIERMTRNGFSREYLYGVFSQVRNRDAVARLWASPASDANPGGWLAYRAKFVNPANIQRGAEFWRQYSGPLQRAQ